MTLEELKQTIKIINIHALRASKVEDWYHYDIFMAEANDLISRHGYNFVQFRGQAKIADQNFVESRRIPKNIECLHRHC